MFYDELTDAQLWNAVRAGDQQAFNRLFDRYWTGVYKTAYKYLKDKPASQEIVHDIFLSLWSRRQTLEITSFPAFLLTATRFQVYSRKRAPRIVLAGDESLVPDVPGAGEADLRIRESELHAQLQQLLQQLPQRCREIFNMSRFQYLSNDEIARQLGISKRTVENQLTTALAHLRMNLKDISGVLIIAMFITHFSK